MNEKYKFESNSEASHLMKKIEDGLIRTISEQNPSFFPEFKFAIESGDHFQIQSILNESTVILNKALLTSPEISDQYIQSLNIAEDLETEGIILRDGSVDLSQLDRIDQLIKSKTKNTGDLTSSRLHACSLIAACVVWIYLAVAQSAAVTINVAAAATVAVYAAVYYKTAVYSGDGGGGGFSEKIKIEVDNSVSLQREMMIDEIATKFPKKFF